MSELTPWHSLAPVQPHPQNPRHVFSVRRSLLELKCSEHCRFGGEVVKYISLKSTERKLKPRKRVSLSAILLLFEFYSFFFIVKKKMYETKLISEIT